MSAYDLAFWLWLVVSVLAVVAGWLGFKTLTNTGEVYAPKTLIGIDREYRPFRGWK